MEKFLMGKQTMLAQEEAIYLIEQIQQVVNSGLPKLKECLEQVDIDCDKLE